VSMFRLRQPGVRSGRLSVGCFAHRVCSYHASSPGHVGSSLGEKTQFVGAKSLYTPHLKFYYPEIESAPPQMECFRLIDDLGSIVPGADSSMPNVSEDILHAAILTMIRVNEFDKVFNDAQRQGRISFYLTSRGEEACSVASAAALHDEDWMLPQYRELGALFWRGFDFARTANQLCANALDVAHGRQLPLHIGGRKENIVTVKSTLGTQCPHAVGIAYGFKMGLHGGKRVAIAYFGEGCASEGDVPSAMNIAAVLRAPAIFFCRNNGYAISTGTKDQYAGDGIAPRGLAFGIPTIRIDGNDFLAIYAATQEARRIGVEEGRPTLIEAMTYRIGAHSTSDDDSAYRTPASPEPGWDSERAYWEARSPIIRLGRYLQNLGGWSPQQEELVRKDARREAIKALNDAEACGPPPACHLFTDVYDDEPSSLLQQRASLRTHLERYREAYPNVTASQLESL